MGPVKKILERLFHVTGSADGSDGLVTLRAFGKLPNYLEYQHLEDSAGLAREFQEWIVAGHSHWVQVVPPGERGNVLTTDLIGFLGTNRDEVIVARMWQSRDSANPPRRFPFTFFVTIPLGKWTEAPLDQIIRSSRLWASLQVAFDRQHLIYERGGTFQRFYRAQKIGIEFDDGTDEREKICAAAKDIPFLGWLESVTPTCQAKDSKAWLGALKGLAVEWNDTGGSGPPVAVRFPLSPLFRLEVQAAAWTRWLEANVKRRLPFSGGLVNHTSKGKVQSMTIVTRPFEMEDFLLTTESAPTCDQAEDVGSLPPPAEDTMDQDQQEDPSPVDILLQGEYSLWDWANMSLVPA